MHGAKAVPDPSTVALIVCGAKNEQEKLDFSKNASDFDKKPDIEIVYFFEKRDKNNRPIFCSIFGHFSSKTFEKQ